MQKLIEGLLKFYIVYMLFGGLAILIICASADLRCFIQTGEGFFSILLKSADTISDEAVERRILDFFFVAFESVPGDTFFDTVLDISADSNVIANMISLGVDLLQSGETRVDLMEKFRNYALFWRDMAVITSSSFVIYAVSNFKEKLAGKDFSVKFGFALSAIFWIFAGYTFAETIVYALELSIPQANLNELYIFIMLVAAFLEAGIHAIGKRCAVTRLIALFFVKIFFNLLRNAFALYMCCVFVLFFDIMSVSNLANAFLNVILLALSAAIIMCTFIAEDKIRNWSEKACTNK